MSEADATPVRKKHQGLLPEFVGELFNGANELALGVSALCRATRVTCETIELAAVGMNDITKIAIDQQKQRMLLNLQEA